MAATRTIFDTPRASILVLVEANRSARLERGNYDYGSPSTGTGQLGLISLVWVPRTFVLRMLVRRVTQLFFRSQISLLVVGLQRLRVGCFHPHFDLSPTTITLVICRPITQHVLAAQLPTD